MAIVITNGIHYIAYGKDGKIRKTSDINEAKTFLTVIDAVVEIQKHSAQTKKCEVFDTITNKVLWRWMTDQEKIAMRENRKKKTKRKTYSQDARKLIYNKANGRCELCGRKIIFEDMTVDHIIPLSQGGLDEVENLQCTCNACNQFKQNIKPDEFNKRVAEIFLYQMEKKYGMGLKWKIVYKLLAGMI